MYNKNLGLKYYSRIKDADIYDILVQPRIKFGNQLMVLSDSR